MTTEELLNLDCNDKTNRKTLNKFLWKVKPFQKLKIEKGADIDIESIEKVLHGISIKYGYKVQSIMPYYEQGEFKFYLTSIMKTKNSYWLGNVYGCTMWEILAKSIIKIYSEILKERKNE